MRRRSLYSGGRNAVISSDIDSLPHVHDDELQLYILGRLSAAQADVFERHALHCPECKNRLATTARFVAQIISLKSGRGHSDKRADPRFQTTDNGFLRCLAPLMLDRWPVQVIDVSRNGLGLLVPTRLAQGALVQVHIGDVFALGEVRYSHQITEHQFRIGIRLGDLVRGKE